MDRLTAKVVAGSTPEGERQVLNTTIMLFLLQDGITNGAIYALLGLALVLVFAVTRVILIPQGEFVTYGALSYAMLATGQVPGTARLAVAMGIVAFGFDLFAGRRSLHPWLVGRAFAINLVLPAAICGPRIDRGQTPPRPSPPRVSRCPAPFLPTAWHRSARHR